METTTVKGCIDCPFISYQHNTAYTGVTCRIIREPDNRIHNAYKFLPGCPKRNTTMIWE